MKSKQHGIRRQPNLREAVSARTIRSPRRAFRARRCVWKDTFKTNNWSSAIRILPVPLLALGHPLHGLQHTFFLGLGSFRLNHPLHVLLLATGAEPVSYTHLRAHETRH